MPIRTFFRDTMELHRRMEGLCSGLSVEYDPTELTRLGGELVKILIPHVETEDEVLYAALIEVVDDWEERRILLESQRAHKMILQLVEDMQNTSAEREEYLGIVLLLNRLLTWHIESEEDVLYDLAYRHLDFESFDRLAKRMRAVQQERLEQVAKEARRANRIPTLLDHGD